MAKLSIDIVTPEKKLVSVQADEVIMPGAHGLFGVRPGHTPYLALLDYGAVTVHEGAGSQTFFVGGGFAEVASDKVLVLADHAEPVSSIDVEVAKRRLEEARERLRG